MNLRTKSALRVAIAVCLLFFIPPVSAEEVSREFRGLTLNANLQMADGSDFGDGMVLLLHGYGAHYKMEIIREAQRALLDNGRSSLAINLSLAVDNRQGYFDCEQPQRDVQYDAVYELGAWAEWLRERGVGEIVMMGHSRGANHLMVYSVERPDPEVSHIVLLAPGLGAEVRELYFERYGIRVEERIELANRQVAAGQGDELMSDIDTMECPRREITANSFLSYYSENNKFRDFVEFLPRSGVPTLIITGSSDERQPHTASHVAPYVDGEGIRLTIIEGAGHFFRDFNIDEAMEAAIEFIDET